MVLLYVPSARFRYLFCWSPASLCSSYYMEIMASILCCLRGDVSRGSKPDGTIGVEHQTWCHWNCMACFTSRPWHCVTQGVMYLPGYDLHSQSSQTKFHAPCADCSLPYLLPFTHHCVKPIDWEHISKGNVMKTLIPLVYSADMRLLDLMLFCHAIERDSQCRIGHLHGKAHC